MALCFVQIINTIQYKQVTHVMTVSQEYQHDYENRSVVHL